jgi:hypothetical protein
MESYCSKFRKGVTKLHKVLCVSSTMKNQSTDKFFSSYRSAVGGYFDAPRHICRAYSITSAAERLRQNKIKEN